MRLTVYLVPAGSCLAQPCSHPLPGPGSHARMYCFASVAHSSSRLPHQDAIAGLKRYAGANDADTCITSHLLRASWVMLEEGPLPSPEDASPRAVDSTQVSLPFAFTHKRMLVMNSIEQAAMHRARVESPSILFVLILIICPLNICMKT